MKKSLLFAGAAVLALSTAASAATLSLTGGSPGDIPSVGESNEVLQNVFGFAPGDFLTGGSFGSQVSLDVDTSLTVDFWGYEAGARNSFSLTGSTATASFATTPGSSAEYALNGLTPLGSTTLDVLAGELTFSFLTNIGGGLSAVNGSNPDNNTTPDAANFYSFLTSTSDTVYLFFDDTGAGDDDNHDDFVVSLTVNGNPPIPPAPVPLPAGGLLLIGGLGALAVARRRKNKS